MADVKVTFCGMSVSRYDVVQAVETAVSEVIEKAVREAFAAALDRALTNAYRLSVVRVHPAAPVRACLWRRNLDGGAWRKRGHVAHRS